MTEKMTLLYVKRTGNVLAFVTRNSEPEGEVTADVLAGSGLLVRYAGLPADTGFTTAQFLVPADSLEVKIADYDELVAQTPRNFYIDPDSKDVAQVDATLSASTPTKINNTQIKVKLGGIVAEKTPVWVQVSGADPDKAQVREAEIDKNADQVDINLLTLDPGQHSVLVLVAGGRTFVDQFTIP